MPRLRQLAALPALALAMAAHPVAQGTPTAAELANRVQARYATVRDFTANFTQSSTSPLQIKPLLANGELKVKKPDRMRWNYASGDKDLFVADGARFYMYFRKDRYVLERKLPAPNESSTALLFLAGRANLARDFVASLPTSQPAGEWRLMLAPKAGPADFKTIAVDVDRTSFALRGFVVTDEEGGVTSFRFTNVRENQNIPDSEFVFSAPRGVEIRRQ